MTMTTRTTLKLKEASAHAAFKVFSSVCFSISNPIRAAANDVWRNTLVPPFCHWFAICKCQTPQPMPEQNSIKIWVKGYLTAFQRKSNSKPAENCINSTSEGNALWGKVQFFGYLVIFLKVKIKNFFLFFKENFKF